jgi:hypothetical protein
LSEHNINPNGIRACIDRWCKERLAGPSAEELRQREGTAAALPAPGAQTGQLQVSDVATLLADILSGAQPIPGGLTEPSKPPAPGKKKP